MRRMNDSQSGKFRPIQNPYIVGNPIEDRKMFFGRVDDFEYIRKKVSGAHKGGIIVLCGSRRSGKTSILFQIKNRVLGNEYIPVLIDMQSITVQTDRDFLELLAREISSALGEPDTLVKDEFREKLDTNPLLAFNEFSTKVTEMLGGRNLIVMFDEYELFESQIDRKRFSKEVLGMLAYWMENSRGIFFLFTGSDKLEARDSRYWESFLGKALHRRISFLRENDTMRLIHEPVRDLVFYEDDVPGRIFQLTAGQPFYTQVICQTLVDHLNEFGKNNITSDDLESVVEEIVENPLPQMIFSWSSMSQLEKICLSIVGELSKNGGNPVSASNVAEFSRSEKIGYELDPNKVRETMERLFHSDLIVKQTEPEGYVFKMDLWRRWVIRMHSVWQTLDEIASSGEELEEGLVRASAKGKLIGFGIAGVAVIAAAIVIAGIMIRGDRMIQVPAALPDSTTLTVHSEPAGADVFLNRTLIGKTPIKARIPARPSFLRVSLSGYREYVDSLKLMKDVPAEKAITLIERTGRLDVRSNPPGALITLDGSGTGLRTPASFDSLSANKLYTVGLTLEGYIPRIIEGIDVIPDSNTIVSRNLSEKVHPLTVICQPAGATISIDEVEQGVAPVSISSIVEGNHTLVAKMNGYQTRTLNIDVPVRNHQIIVTLDPLPPGTLILEILPYADVWIDGQLKKQDAVNYVDELSPGEHTIELRHPVYDDLTEKVIVVSGSELKKFYDLKTRNR
jgi:hypothetical protein